MFVLLREHEKQGEIMKTNIPGLLVIISATLILFGLSAFGQTGDFASKQWKLTHLNGIAVGETKARIEIDPAAGRFNGNAGCNSMFGLVKVSGKDISFSRVATTRMVCANTGVIKLESDFTKALGQAMRYKVSGSVLSIYAGNRRIMKFKAAAKVSENLAPAGTDARLEAKKWVLEAIGREKVGPIGNHAFIVFDAEKGSAGGDTSCNVYGGEYTMKGSSLSIKQLISTMRACVEDGRMQIERSFLDGLGSTDRFEIKGGKLYLYRGDETLLVFRGENK